MFVNAEWQKSRYARANIGENHVEGMVTRQHFWTQVERVVKAIKP